ncbi:glycosyltransferase [Candidatus Dojkabacteria bacterium]|nr:glycosyltransferase [Candidatus Dojkabacteria bacterium]
MISIIITSWKEPKTIGKCIRCIADKKYSGLNEPFEILQVSPDRETLDAGLLEAKKRNLSKREYIQIQDPGKGKPSALNLAFKKAKGEIIILTDGDTYFGKDAVKQLLLPFKNKNVGGVSGRPVSQDSLNNMFGYWGHLLSDSAHHRRSHTMSKVKDTEYHISGKTFFPLSGYISAIRNLDITLPENVIIDDGYISYAIRNLGYEIAYAPKAISHVKFPQNMSDYMKQKIRDLSGSIQLEKFGLFQRDKQTRSFWIELQYGLWVLSYAKNLKEFFWSLYLFPTRLIVWIRSFWRARILNRDLPKTGWERIESTK